MKRNYVFKFKEVMFDTDDGLGSDDQLNQLLNNRFGHTSYHIRATTREEAFAKAVSRVTEDSGFKIINVEYDITMT